MLVFLVLISLFSQAFWACCALYVLFLFSSKYFKSYRAYALKKSTRSWHPYILLSYGFPLLRRIWPLDYILVLFPVSAVLQLFILRPSASHVSCMILSLVHIMHTLSRGEVRYERGFCWVDEKNRKKKEMIGRNEAKWKKERHRSRSFLHILYFCYFSFKFSPSTRDSYLLFGPFWYLGYFSFTICPLFREFVRGHHYSEAVTQSRRCEFPP